MEHQLIAPPSTLGRVFISDDIDMNDWASLSPYYDDLLSRSVKNVLEFEKWLNDKDELEGAISDFSARLYISMTCDTTNKDIEEKYLHFIDQIESNLLPVSHRINEKVEEFSKIDGVDQKKYLTYFREVKEQLRIYREENDQLITQIKVKQKEFSNISGLMTVEIDNEEKTLQQASLELSSNNRDRRKHIFDKIVARRAKDKDALNNLFDKLLAMRNQIALNAGFENYRDYKFADLGRFEYNADDCKEFHHSIQQEVVPFVNEFMNKRKENLDIIDFKPYDTNADFYGKGALKPFRDDKDLIAKTIKCFNQLDPYFGECIQKLDDLGHLDLVSRKGKSPGGYNCPLFETGAPFIFMNAVGSVSDLTTMVHEGGHAIHSFLTNDLEILAFKSFPSEVAELASMTMELFSMEHWDIFFDNEDDLKRAKLKQLERVLDVLPWVATVDAFQHWIYENPTCNAEERKDAWVAIFSKYDNKVVDWTGYETTFENYWQKQGHIFQVPFYYIEYGIAQLGAIAMWRQFKQNREQAIENYKKALSLGYQKTISEIYQTAGIKFDFSQAYIKELVTFVKGEVAKLL